MVADDAMCSEWLLRFEVMAVPAVRIDANRALIASADDPIHPEATELAIPAWAVVNESWVSTCHPPI